MTPVAPHSSYHFAALLRKYHSRVAPSWIAIVVIALDAPVEILTNTVKVEEVVARDVAVAPHSSCHFAALLRKYNSRVAPCIMDRDSFDSGLCSCEGFEEHGKG